MANIAISILLVLLLTVHALIVIYQLYIMHKTYQADKFFWKTIIHTDSSETSSLNEDNDEQNE